MWRPADNRSATKHPDSYHAGRPPTKGEKWAFNLWFHEGPTQAGHSATQSKLHAEGKAGPSIRDLLSHVAKADQARQKEGKVSDGETRPNREPTDEEKKMLEEKLQKFFTANTPGQFKRKEAARPRSTVPDKTGFDAVQAAIQELVEQKRLGTADAAEAAAAAAAAGAELEPQPLPQSQHPCGLVSLCNGVRPLQRLPQQKWMLQHGTRLLLLPRIWLRQGPRAS